MNWKVVFYGFLCFTAGLTIGMVRVVDPHAYLLPAYEVEKIQQDLDQLREKMQRILETVEQAPRRHSEEPGPKRH